MSLQEILERYLHEMDSFPGRPELLFEELPKAERLLYRRKAETMAEWLGMHNYYFYHFTSGGLFGKQNQR